MRISDWSSDVCSSDLISSCRSHLLTRTTLHPARTPRKARRHLLAGNLAGLTTLPYRPPLTTLPYRPPMFHVKPTRSSTRERAHSGVSARALCQDWVDRKSTRLNSSH